MKKVIGAILLLSAIATASIVEGNPEVFTQLTTDRDSSIETSNGRCDSLERLLGMCRSSEDILIKN